jgi:hypothetical protein
MNYIISKENLQSLLNYLGTRPYSEVAKLVGTLVTLQPAPADSKNKNESAKKAQ